MLPLFNVVFKRIDYYLQVFFIIQEISIQSIHKNCFYIMLSDIACIGFLYIEQIFVRDILLIYTIAFFNILLKLLYRRMQVDDDIRENQLLLHNVK